MWSLQNHCKNRLSQQSTRIVGVSNRLLTIGCGSGHSELDTLWWVYCGGMLLWVYLRYPMCGLDVWVRCVGSVCGTMNGFETGKSQVEASRAAVGIAAACLCVLAMFVRISCFCACWLCLCVLAVSVRVGCICECWLCLCVLSVRARATRLFNSHGST